MAVDRVEKRLRKVTAALDAAGVKYAVIGGNAVAAWVARVDITATRTTKDVDILLDHREFSRAAQAIQSVGFWHEEIVGVHIFIEPDEPSVRSAVHIVWANQRVLPNNVEPAPSVDESEVDPQGFRVLTLPALVRMKLTAHRTIDRVHIEDMLRVGLIDDRVKSSLSAKLLERLRTIEENLPEII